ncbi:MAG TPA: 23S rRNA (adenine(2030)-N(6))-methyltransferase RlmJ [Burkholderiales bacterium]|nr:23S rRNA (adenine(2030)-N(6))-methyltransferase RlmJ [Burkholderiales bacterium]
MLAYRHLFHAGNFADVFKHSLLSRLVLGLQRKDKPFFVLDTHAGIGRYDLEHEWAQKNAEHRDGVSLVWGRKDVPNEFVPYFDAIRGENTAGAMRFYPGSPRIVRRLLRPVDRLVLIELNRKDCESLGNLFLKDRQTTVHLMDGYQSLRAFLPPKERRGLVFIDSSFDRAREFDRLTEGLAEAHRRFATGVYALWYPLMESTAMRAFERGMAETGIRKMLQLEISVTAEGWTEGMRGCGMIVVNPPFGFEVQAQAMLKWLQVALARDGAGGHRVAWLSGE